MLTDILPLLALTVVASWSLATAVHDVRTLRIPDVILGSGLMAVAVAVGCVVLVDGSARLGPVAAGAATLFGAYLLLRVVAPAHLGGGDLRLAPLVGALGGLGGVPGIVCVAVVPFAITAVLGLGLVWRSVRIVPHGPAMVAAALGVTAWVFTS